MNMAIGPHCPPPRPPQRGVAAVEFALLATLLVTLLLAASEFGRAMYQYNTVVKGARAAARYLSQFPPGDANAIAAARNLVVYGDTASNGDVLVPGLTTSMVSVCDASNCAASKRQFTDQTYVNLVTVAITGLKFQPLATWILSDFTFAPIAATMTQGVG